jgi:hypothetical protein
LTPWATIFRRSAASNLPGPAPPKTHVSPWLHRLKTTPEMAFYLQTVDFVPVDKESAAKT